MNPNQGGWNPMNPNNSGQPFNPMQMVSGLIGNLPFIPGNPGNQGFAPGNPMCPPGTMGQGPPGQGGNPNFMPGQGPPGQCPPNQGGNPNFNQGNPNQPPFNQGAPNQGGNPNFNQGNPNQGGNPPNQGGNVNIPPASGHPPGCGCGCQSGNQGALGGNQNYNPGNNPNQGVPPNQGGPIGQGVQPNQGMQQNQGIPPNQGMQQNQGMPPNQGAPIGQGTQPNQGMQPNQGGNHPPGCGCGCQSGNQGAYQPGNPQNPGNQQQQFQNPGGQQQYQNPGNPPQNQGYAGAPPPGNQQNPGQYPMNQGQQQQQQPNQGCNMQNQGQQQQGGNPNYPGGNQNVPGNLGNPGYAVGGGVAPQNDPTGNQTAPGSYPVGGGGMAPVDPSTNTITPLIPGAVAASLNMPFTDKFFAPLQDRQTVRIQGTVNANPQRIDVNLLKNGDNLDSGAIAVLTLSFRFNEGQLVCNSNPDGNWGSEERVSNPLSGGQSFDLKIKVLAQYFQILVNNQDVHHFNYRTSYTDVQYLQVTGDCVLNRVDMGGVGSYTNPYQEPLANGHLNTGDRLCCSVSPNGGERFNIDLTADNGDTPFHFNPRFGPQVVVRNSFQNGQWQNEEKDANGPFPFQQGAIADVVITNGTSALEIYVNGQMYCTFNHRVPNPSTDYTGLRIQGGCDIHSIEINGTPTE